MADLERVDSELRADVLWTHGALRSAGLVGMEWEVRLDIPELEWGWADAIHRPTCRLVELKFGPQTPANPYSWQCRALALGYAAVLGDSAAVHVLSIHGQWRIISEAVYTAADLDDIRQALRRLRQRAERDDAPAIPGEQCRHCEGLGVCVAAQKELASTLALTGADASQRRLAPHTISRLLGLFKLVSMLEDRVRRQAHDVWDAGGSIPGWRRIKSRSPRRWRDPEEAKRMLQQWITENNRPDVPVVREVLLSPHEIEQLAGPEISPLLETLTDTTPVWRIMPESSA